MNDDQATKRAALIVATFSSFTTPFMLSAVNVALPSIQKEFMMNAVLLSWVPTSFILTSTVALLPFGRLADIYGRKRTFTLGFVLFTIASALAALSFSASMLLISRALQGIGGAMIFATGVAIVSSVFSPGERGKALGITVAAVYSGLCLGPFIGGISTEYLTWRSVFFMMIPLGLTVVLLIKRKLHGEWAEARGESFDYKGSVIYGLSITTFMLGVSLLPDLKALWLVALGIFGVFIFAYWESQIENPVFNVRLFRENRVFALSNLAALINYSATFAVTFLLSLYLQYIKGLSPRDAGLVLIAQPIMMATVSPFTGRLSDRVEPRIVASLGMAIMTVGLFLFTFISADTRMLLVMCNMVLIGVGFALFSSPNMNAIMSSVEKRYYGVASGSVGTMRLMGQMLSMGIATSIFALYIGRVQITAEYYPVFIEALRKAFSVFVVLSFGGVFASLARGKLHGKAGESEKTKVNR